MARCVAARAAFTALVVWLDLGAAVAQERPGRPFQGLFGGGERSRRPQTLDFTGSAFGAYDQNVTGDEVVQGTQLDPRLQLAAFYGGFDAGLSYTKRTERVSFDAAASTSVSYFPDLASIIRDHQIGAGLSTSLGRRTTIRASQTVGFAPYQFNVSSEVSGRRGRNRVRSPATNYAIASRTAYTYLTDVNATQTLTRRVSLDFNYSFHYFDFTGEDDDLDFMQQIAGARFTRQVTPHGALNVGYAYRTGRYDLRTRAKPIRSHDLALGGTYGRGLKVLPRTTFSFDIGSSIMVQDSLGTPDLDAPADNNIYYLVSGSANLTREIGRTWSADLTYLRGVSFIGGFADPVAYNTIGGGIGGPFSRRVEFSAFIEYATGNIGVAVDGRGFGTYAGGASLNIALTRMVALYTDYSFYHYQFEEGVQLPRGVARGLNRHGVQAGLSFWAPLLR